VDRPTLNAVVAGNQLKSLSVTDDSISVPRNGFYNGGGSQGGSKKLAKGGQERKGKECGLV